MTPPHAPGRRRLFAAAALGGCAAALPQAAAAAAPAPEAPGVAGRGPAWTPVPLPMQAPAREGWLDVGGGAKLWYWDTGDGPAGTGGDGERPAVVFLHSGSQSGAGWGHQQPAFAAAGFRAIGYSRRGCFRSEGGSPQDPGVACEDLDRLIAHLGIRRPVHLVAVALGAFYALDFALAYPQKLRSLTIVSSYLGIDESERAYAEANARLRPKEFNALPVEVRELHPSYRAGNPAGTEAWVALSRQARVGPRIDPLRPVPMTWARVESIRHPVLLMTGDGDLYTPPALLRMQAAHLPQAETVVVPEAGHAPNWEQPAFFNRTVLSFLRRHVA
ncbi:MAG: alpha/beta fold hydrolase [Xylophilus ampelinus]